MLDPSEIKFEIPVDPKKVKVGDKTRMSCPGCGEMLEVTFTEIVRCSNGCCTHLLLMFDCKCGMSGNADLFHKEQREEEREYVSKLQRHFCN